MFWQRGMRPSWYLSFFVNCLRLKAIDVNEPAMGGTLNLREWTIQFNTMLQGWTLQEWTNQHGVARGDNAGVDNAGVVNVKQARQVEM